MFPNYHGVFASAFPFFGSAFTRQREPTPRDCCKREESIWAITVIDSKRRSEIHPRPLLELPLILLINKKHHLTSAKQLWSRDKIEETLITFPRADTVQTHFQRGLERLGVEWFPGIEANSTRLIEHYVANGYGVGATIGTPGFKPPRGVRVISLPSFPPVVVGAAWAGKLSPNAQQFLAEIEIEASAVKRGTKSL